MTTRRLLGTSLLSLALLALVAARPEETLAGKWQVQSIGGKALPESKAVLWKIDDKTIEVTLNGQLTSRSTYKLGKDGDHPAIWLSPEGKTDPDRIGWYEFSGAELHLQTGKQMPTAWDATKTVILLRAK